MQQIILSVCVVGILLTQQEGGFLSVLYKAIKKMHPGTQAE